MWPVWPEAEGVPGCGGERRTSYPEIEDNAFYCPDEDFIAFDDELLFPRLDEDFGRYTVAMVLAHEWGHAIQARLGSSLPGVITELQADCFAGSWMDRVRDGGAAGLQLTDPDLRLAISGILEFRDSPGTSADDEGAHGSAFDRLGSFQDGLEGGAQACEAYAASPPVVLELPFNNLDDAQTQGDMPLETLVSSVPADLDRFWGELLGRSGTTFGGLSGTVQSYPTGGPYPRCRGLTTSDFEQGVVYCPSPEFVAYELGGANARLHTTIGDFSVGVLFADRWAEAVQRRLGLGTEGGPAALQRDCLTGVWVEDVVPRPTRQQDVQHLARRSRRSRPDVPAVHGGRRGVGRGRPGPHRLVPQRRVHRPGELRPLTPSEPAVPSAPWPATRRRSPPSTSAPTASTSSWPG